MRCEQSLLWTLVEQADDPGAEAEPVAAHLESCESCRRALEEIGADEPWWNDACVWLSRAGEDLAGHGSEPSVPGVDLSFLDSPTHPEMLGRIGRYEVESLIGRGGMGVVLRAFDSDLHRSVAVKVMAPEWAASVPARRRFAREAQAAASIAHENVIPIYNVESSAPLPYLVMRYIPGTTLENWVKTQDLPDASTILRVAVQLAEGLSAAHRHGLIHRDIKPGNVLVGENVDRVWITDFGLARAADSVTLTRTGVIAGTPHYMSPEQARGESLDHRSDLFSLGGVLFFLCTGRPPFEAENTLSVLHKIVSERPESLASIRNDLPPSLVSLVRRLLARSPDRRPHDCAELLRSLNIAQSEMQKGLVARAPMSPSKRRMWIGFAAAICIALVALGVNSWIPRPANLPPATQENPRINDPWHFPVDSGQEINPYLATAAERVESAIDDRQFQPRFDRLESQVLEMDLGTPTYAIPEIMLDDSIWQHDVSEIESRLRQLSMP